MARPNDADGHRVIGFEIAVNEQNGRRIVNFSKQARKVGIRFPQDGDAVVTTEFQFGLHVDLVTG
jgi:hypothetical protein